MKSPSIYILSKEEVEQDLAKAYKQVIADLLNEALIDNEYDSRKLIGDLLDFRSNALEWKLERWAEMCKDDFFKNHPTIMLITYPTYDKGFHMLTILGSNDQVGS